MIRLYKYILENNPPKCKHDIKNHVITYKTKNILTYNTDVVTYPIITKNAYEIETLNVKNKRNHIGTALLNTLLEYTDNIGVNVVLYASPLDDSISEDDLIQFYKKNGFEQDDRTTDKKCLIYKA